MTVVKIMCTVSEKEDEWFSSSKRREGLHAM
jgi:hypothetical protein